MRSAVCAKYWLYNSSRTPADADAPPGQLLDQMMRGDTGEGDPNQADLTAACRFHYRHCATHGIQDVSGAVDERPPLAASQADRVCLIGQARAHLPLEVLDRRLNAGKTTALGGATEVKFLGNGDKRLDLTRE